jgi:hypothetical protein
MPVQAPHANHHRTTARARSGALLLAVAACTANPAPNDDPAATPTPALPPPVAPAPVVAPVPAPVATPPPARPELLALAEARQKFRAHDYASAWALMEPIARAVQSDGGLLCESGYLAHHAGAAGPAEALLRRGIVVLARDSTRPGRDTRAMCLYDLALVQEAAGNLGDAVCSLRRSEALRKNSTVARKRAELGAKLPAGDFRCEVGRVARTRDVRALAGEYAAANSLKIDRIERSDAGEFVVHTVHLEPGERDPADIELYTDVQYVILDRQGQLFPLGVLAYTDETATYFRSGASFSFAGFKPSPLGTLVLFTLASWSRGDSEHVRSKNAISSLESDNLLMCRFVPAADGGDVACAQVPLGTQETSDSEGLEDETTGADTGDGPGDEPRVSEWGARVGYTLDEAAGELVFVLERGDPQMAAALGLPLGRIGVAELFARHLAESTDLGL